MINVTVSKANVNETEELFRCETTRMIFVHALERHIAFKTNATNLNDSLRATYAATSMDTIVSTMDPSSFKFVETTGDVVAEPHSYEKVKLLLENVTYAETSEPTMENPHKRREPSFHFMVKQKYLTALRQMIDSEWRLRFYCKSKLNMRQAFIHELYIETIAI